LDDDDKIEKLTKQIRFFYPKIDDSYQVLYFYGADLQQSRYDLETRKTSLPKRIISSSRIKTLYKLANKNPNTSLPSLVITSAIAVAQKIIPKEIVKFCGFFAKTGDRNSIDQIARALVFNGYKRNATANDVGEFAIRGSIVDIVVSRAGDVIGYRIDFTFNKIESIKEFDVLTQVSQDFVKEVEILPVSEVILNEETCENFRNNYRKTFGVSKLENDQLYSAVSTGRSFPSMERFLPFFYSQELVSIFDYFKTCSKILLFNNDLCYKYEKLIKIIKDEHKTSTYNNRLDPSETYFQDSFLSDVIAKSESVVFRSNPEFSAIPDFANIAKTKQKDVVEIVDEFIKNESASSQKKVIIFCFDEISKERIEKLFAHKYQAVVVPADNGFSSKDVILISEAEIFGEKIIRKKTTNNSAITRILEEGLAIKAGELVVHRDHGIGKFDGVHTISHQSASASVNIKCDMLKIQYAGNDALFVSVSDIDLITRYGIDNGLVELDRLGSQAWKNRKEKARNKIKISAGELLQIAAKRALTKAPSFIPDEYFYNEFKAGFGFTETDDQARAIADVESDLAKGTLMDRLICGDVGFGKTEVAIRASFVVVSAASDKIKSQVAIVVPTTLLCRQHFQNFSKRFSGTKIKIEQLSRFVTPSKASKIKKEIEGGEIDIIIGTHSLLQKNIKFKNLSLVIIDEEQHFGVAQKERLKELKNDIHILTLSATPIPRTLQMSLTGIKDLSLIATPPQDRLSVRNFVMNYDETIIREAIMREYNRSGKVFFVVPRISDISGIEADLKKMLPEINIKHADGKMPPNQ
jgi:transcription-repair coupling factor (superfamily II helicase)